jgi:hypothetical protein
LTIWIVLVDVVWKPGTYKKELKSTQDQRESTENSNG